MLTERKKVRAKLKKFEIKDFMGNWLRIHMLYYDKNVYILSMSGIIGY